MNIAGLIAARQRLKQQMRFWRVLAVLSVVVLVAVTVSYSVKGKYGGGGFSDTIARVQISGLIFGRKEVERLFQNIEKSKRHKAVILHINSPGGTTVGSEIIYNSICSLSKKKPVVVVMDSVATSGGYIAALGGDHIIAQGNTVTGSIGVVMQWAQTEELLGKIGVKVKEVKSGTLKAQPNGFTTTSPEAIRAVEGMVEDSFQWFLGLVKERRKLSDKNLKTASDGRVYSGRQALKVGLIDELGDEKTALSWLQSKKGIDKDLAIIDVKAESYVNNFSFGVRVMAKFFTFLGMENVVQFYDGSPLQLNGTLALWQPGS